MGKAGTTAAVDGASRRSRLKWAAGIVGLALVATIGGLLFVGANIVDWTKQRVIDSAKQQGLVLELNDLELSLNKIHLRDARARLEGVSGLTIYLQSVDIALLGLKPNRVYAAGAVIQAVGAPTNLLNEVRAWQAKYNATPRPELAKARLTWQEALDGPPFLVLDGVTFADSPKPLGPLGQDVTIQAERAQAGTATMAPLAAAVHSEPEAIEIGIGSTEWEHMTARGGWKKQPNGDELHISLGPLQLGTLLAAVGIKLEDPKLASSHAVTGASLLRTADNTWPYLGHFAVEVAGYTPPHPPELQGFDFGKSTRVDSAFRIDAALTKAELSGFQLAAGEFKLSGRGNVRRTAALSARVQLELKGQLRCEALASAVATSKLGQSYGQWVARHANELVRGTVDITLQVDADTNALKQAKVSKIIGVGCGLRPLSVHQLLTLDLPPPPDMELIRHLGRDVPGMGGAVPDLKNLGLPDLPAPDWMKAKPH